MLALQRAAKRPEILLKAARSRRLGLAASRAFRRFVQLYRKYSPDQPRDDRGRWVETGVGDRAEVTGAVVVRKYRTGDPRIDSVTEVLERKVAEAMDRAGPGFGPQYGTMVHQYFAESVIATDIPGIRAHGVETSILAGEVSSYGAEDSVRTDVLLRNSDDQRDRIIAVWDLKTGRAVLSPSRVDELRSELRVDKSVPIIELHSINGVSVKSVISYRHGY